MIVLSFIMNCAIVAMTAFGFAAMFAGWDFMGRSGSLESPGIKLLRFFTVDSNVLMGVCSLLMAIAEIPLLSGEASALPVWILTLKLAGTAAVALTFLVTLVFLRPQFEDPGELYRNSNLFFHLVTPLAAMFSFLVAERTDAVPFAGTFIGVLPVAVYAVYYIANVFRHLTDGRPDKKYDFYNFLNGRAERAPAAAAVILLGAYVIALLLWLVNRAGA